MAAACGGYGLTEEVEPARFRAVVFCRCAPVVCRRNGVEKGNVLRHGASQSAGSPAGGRRDFPYSFTAKK